MTRTRYRWLVVYHAVNVDIVPQRAATALGIMGFAFAIAGFLAPAITGWVLDLRGSFADGFLLMTAPALSSVLVVLLFHHPDSDRGAPATRPERRPPPVAGPAQRRPVPARD